MFRLRMLAGAALLTAFSSTALAANPKTYPSEDAATKVCKSPVVWGTPDSGAYHVKGTRYYGATKSGVWVCEAGAKKAGWHAAKNEQ